MRLEQELRGAKRDDVSKKRDLALRPARVGQRGAALQCTDAIGKGCFRFHATGRNRRCPVASVGCSSHPTGIAIENGGDGRAWPLERGSEPCDLGGNVIDTLAQERIFGALALP